MKQVATPPATAPTPAAFPVLRMLLAEPAAAQDAADPADGDRAISSAGMALLARMMFVRCAMGAFVLILAATIIMLR